MAKIKQQQNQRTLLAWVAQDLGSKQDFVQYAGELHKVLESYGSTKEIIRVLAQHSPMFVSGIYAKAYDQQGKLLKDVLLTTNLEWQDDLEEIGLIDKKEIIARHERKFKWLKIKTPVSIDEIRVPSRTERVEIYVKQQENQKAESKTNGSAGVAAQT